MELKNRTSALTMLIAGILGFAASF
ncbi:MAG: hypothetical protein RL540_1301, partial [Actinomycetota bacterium]